MKSRTVEELLLELDLTDEEMGKQAELIEECLERQKRLIDDRKKSEAGIRAIEAHLDNISRTLLIIHQSIQQVNDRLAEAMLKNLPPSKMPKA